MAHSCPDCGMACYCGGDIDDCLLDETEAANTCIHCEPANFIQDEDDPLDDYIEGYGEEQ